MKAVVCVKVVNGELNPFDASALECALEIENSEVTVVTMGPKSALNALSMISRLDISETIILNDPLLAGADTLATSYALSLIIKKINPDIVLCGRQSIDGDTAQVGPCMAEKLGFELITNAMSVEVYNGAVKCMTRYGEEGVKLPAVVTVERFNTLRFPRIGSKPKEIKILSASDIDADKSRCGINGSPTRVLKTFENHSGERKCQFISFAELDDVVKYALNRKKEQIPDNESVKKLKRIVVIGDELKQKAKLLADDVKVIKPQDYKIIAELIKDEEVVLWNADWWGRKNAPRVAALLETGLCADCTHLETDGNKLFMYRPAFGERLVAKIECSSNPQMATVRNASHTKSGIIFGFGRGTLENPEAYKKLAEKYNAEVGMSRPMIDMNAGDYSMQIGLTGKSISSDVYVACGISGAVQHVCGIENVGTVIAINPDNDAEIFKFADYGIIDKL